MTVEGLSFIAERKLAWLWIRSAREAGSSELIDSGMLKTPSLRYIHMH